MLRATRLCARLRKLHDGAQAVRRDGSAAIDLAYIACGRFDGFWEDGLNAWMLRGSASDRRSRRTGH